jgi:UDP-N-acetyl-D-galactosamine dehydrogenase
MKLREIKLAIVGLGYVGLPFAIEFNHNRSFNAFDVNQRKSTNTSPKTSPHY